MRTVSHAPPERHYNTFDLVQLADSIAHETPYDGTGPVKAPSRLVRRVLGLPDDVQDWDLEPIDQRLSGSGIEADEPGKRVNGHYTVSLDFLASWWGASHCMVSAVLADAPRRSWTVPVAGVPELEARVGEFLERRYSLLPWHVATTVLPTSGRPAGVSIVRRVEPLSGLPVRWEHDGNNGGPWAHAVGFVENLHHVSVLPAELRRPAVEEFAMLTGSRVEFASDGGRDHVDARVSLETILDYSPRSGATYRALTSQCKTLWEGW